jgi:RNA polymerase sigma factor (sigma-70 family)
MSDPDRTRDLLPAMAEARARFMELVAEVRPELHRYCARMAGKGFDGEDIVQDTLAKAYFALSEMGEPPPLRAWLFRIAHNTAMDFLRRYEWGKAWSSGRVPVGRIGRQCGVAARAARRGRAHDIKPGRRHRSKTRGAHVETRRRIREDRNLDHAVDREEREADDRGGTIRTSSERGEEGERGQTETGRGGEDKVGSGFHFLGRSGFRCLPAINHVACRRLQEVRNHMMVTRIFYFVRWHASKCRTRASHSTDG